MGRANHRVDKRSGTLLFTVEGGGPAKGQGASPESALDYLRTYHPVNPRLLPSIQLEMGAWMHCHEHFDDAFVAANAFYQDFLIPYGGRYLSGTKLVDSDQFLVMFGAMRGFGTQPLNREEVGQLTRLRGHMVEALDTYLQLRDTYAQAGVGKQLLDEFRYPALLVDQYRAVVYRNPAATELLNRHDTLIFSHGRIGAGSESGGQLRCRHAEDDTRLLEALRSLGINDAPAAMERRNRAFVRLSSAAGARGLAVFLTAIRPEEVMRGFGHATLALLVLHEPSSERVFDPFIIGEIFGLTPAESKVAVRVARGQGIEQMAAESCVASSTIRSQLKSIFAKTGTGRQSELASLLTNLPDL